MLRIVLAGVLLSLGAAGAFAQSTQAPVMEQTTSTVDGRKSNIPRPKLKKTSLRERMEMERGMDTTLPKNRRSRRLRPDSLRRGGATRVDSVRR